MCGHVEQDQKMKGSGMYYYGKHFGLVIVSFFILLGGVAFAADSDCARLRYQKRGIHCGENSLLVVVQNDCGHTIQISTCIEITEGNWDCRLDHAAAPEKKVGNWVCESTGNYKFIGCSRDAADCRAHP